MAQARIATRQAARSVVPIPGNIRPAEKHLEIIDAIGADVRERAKMSKAERLKGGGEERVEVPEGLLIRRPAQDIKGYALKGAVTRWHCNCTQQQAAFGLDAVVGLSPITG
jgi:hypothetical protein